MKRIVVDTNIVFSTFLNVNSRIGQILLNGVRYYDFYAPEYIRDEIIIHKERIKKIGVISEYNFLEIYGIIIQKLNLLNHTIIPLQFYQSALNLCLDIDVDDTPFVAINDFVQGTLWTGDLKLINGLAKKGYSSLITTDSLYNDFTQKEKRGDILH